MSSVTMQIKTIEQDFPVVLFNELRSGAIVRVCE